MHSTGLARPPRPARQQPPGPAQPGPRAAPAPRRPDADFGRVLRWSLLVSLAVHVLVLLISPAFLRVGLPPGLTDTEYRLQRPAREVQLLNPVASQQAEAEEEAPPTRALPRRAAPAPSREPAWVPVPRSSARPRDPVASAPATGAPSEATSARDALRPGYRDPRLWVNPNDPSAQPQKTDHQLYMEHLEARIAAQNDSAYGGGPNTDWTFKDKEGRRWGLSEDGLHLGGVTIPPSLVPRPAPTGDNQSIEAEREEQRQRDEIRRQEEDRERKRTQEERAKATRERENAKRKKGSGG